MKAATTSTPADRVDIGNERSLFLSPYLDPKAEKAIFRGLSVPSLEGTGSIIGLRWLQGVCVITWMQTLSV